MLLLGNKGCWYKSLHSLEGKQNTALLLYMVLLQSNSPLGHSCIPSKQLVAKQIPRRSYCGMCGLHSLYGWKWPKPSVCNGCTWVHSIAWDTWGCNPEDKGKHNPSPHRTMALPAGE